MNGRTVSTAKIDAVIKAQAAKPVCLTCSAKGARIQGSLASIAWKSGSADLTAPYGGMSVRPDEQQDEVLPEGSEIEIDASDNEKINNFKGTSVFDDVGAVSLKALEQ